MLIGSSDKSFRANDKSLDANDISVRANDILLVLSEISLGANDNSKSTQRNIATATAIYSDISFQANYLSNIAEISQLSCALLFYNTMYVLCREKCSIIAWSVIMQPCLKSIIELHIFS